jgi:aminopeptidase N
VTGDIFVPKSWLDATPGTHRSAFSAKTVRTFLEERPDYNEPLRMQVLRAADMVFRAHAITGTALCRTARSCNQ